MRLDARFMAIAATNVKSVYIQSRVAARTTSIISSRILLGEGAVHALRLTSQQADHHLRLTATPRLLSGNNPVLQNMIINSQSPIEISPKQVG